VSGADGLELTGERTLPGIPGERYWFHRHEAAYAWVANTQLVRGDFVIEAGAGEGYGAELLRTAGAAQVLALDYDAAAATHMTRTYPHVLAARANLIALPVATDAADLVVSMQVIEHIWNVSELLAEFARVARPGGRLVISTPNREVFSPGLAREAKPTNPFHVQEFDATQLVDLMTSHGFTHVRVRGLHHAERLAAFETTTGPIVRRLIGLDPHSLDTWPSDLADLVYGCSAADFTINDEVDGAHDLIVTAVAG